MSWNSKLSSRCDTLQYSSDLILNRGLPSAYVHWSSRSWSPRGFSTSELPSTCHAHTKDLSSSRSRRLRMRQARAIAACSPQRAISPNGHSVRLSTLLIS